MSNEDRTPPEVFLKALQRIETKSTRGKLKIFLGMSAGVGKTYAMLLEAQRQNKLGTNIVIGIVYTHGREETAALLQGLKSIPPKRVLYKDLWLEEFDVDQTLFLKPDVVLIDELAHTNAPGSRHPKRWQDVAEVLENGIDVYTTLNVQHIESLKDIVEGISDIKIQESVPDKIIESADFIELIDLTPQELLKRLKEGKVYLPERSEIAIQNFFQEDRLTALREIVLRYAAEKVDRDLQDLLPIREGGLEWKPREKLMVAIGPDPSCEKLIRTTRRLASSQNAPWIAVYVDDGRGLSEEENITLAKHLALARDMGAEVVTTQDPQIVEGIKRIARQKRISQIVVGRRPVSLFMKLLGHRALADQLTHASVDIDIHIVKQQVSLKKIRSKLTRAKSAHPLWPYLIGSILVVALSLIHEAFLPFLGYKVVGILFLIDILFLSLFFRKGPIFFISALFGCIWSLFFVPVFDWKNFYSQEDFAFFVIYFCAAISTGVLVDRAREHKEMLAKREQYALALVDLVREIHAAANIEEAIDSVKKGLNRIFRGSFEFLVKRCDGGIDFSQKSEWIRDEKEKNAAIWVFENGKEAGWSTDTLPQSKNLYFPMKSFIQNVGVLIYNDKATIPLTPEERNFIYTTANELGNRIERSFIEEKRKQNEQAQKIEATRTSILNRISTIFQQPLAISQNSLKTLKNLLEEHQGAYGEIVKIERSLEELLEILANISAMAQLSQGLVPLQFTKTSIQDILETCRDHLRKSLENHRVIFDIQEGLPDILIDFHLIEMVLLNLITNAICYSPLGSTIEIIAKEHDLHVQIEIRDEGKGIPEEELEAIFEKFYTLSDETHRGIGLGLSIAKTIAELHHGSLRAENRTPKGTRFILSLPLNLSKTK